MFTQPVSSPPPGPPPSSSAPSRPSRLRGLSYLRNYTQNHLLSREGHHGSSPAAGTGSGNTSSNGGSGSTSPSRQHQQQSSTSNSGSGSGSGLTRSLSYSPTSSGPPPSNGLTLISSTPDSSAAARNHNSAAAASASQSGADGQDPAVEAGLDETATSPTSNPVNEASLEQTQSAATMARTQTSTNTGDASTSAAGNSAAATNGNASHDALPSIRFSAYYDPRSTRPSLTFPPISRTLPTGSEKIRVGRYSERDSHSMSNMPGNQPSAAPVGFKSKVVSRRHCEFWYEDGKWYIKDVKSSSGTFLNHIRLSPPSQESKAFPVNDGDIVQLGIDFKGGEEMIFRCVKMRLELNRGWQNKLNTFNMAAHKRLQTMASSGTSGSTSQDCSICLGAIAPCQSLFVAPCSHTWHFKCVRSLLTSPQYPIFICPNCRAGADLEADVDELAEEWEQLREQGKAAEAEEENSEGEGASGAPAVQSPDTTSLDHVDSLDIDAADVTVNITPESPHKGTLSHAVSGPLPIRNAASGAGRAPLRDSRTPSPPGLNGTEGPITPRNDAGPWVFDGSAGRRPDGPTSEMRSLDAAADMDINQLSSDDSSR